MITLKGVDPRMITNNLTPSEVKHLLHSKD